MRWLVLGRMATGAKAAADAGKPAAEVASQVALAGSVAGVNKGAIQGVVNLAPVAAAQAAASADGSQDADLSKATEGSAAEGSPAASADGASTANGASTPNAPVLPADTPRFAGGIVAQNDGTIADCANLASVANTATAGNSAAAGIAAQGTGTIATSYNAGSVKAAQNAAYITTLLTAEGDYASVVDEATCYLANGEGATYEGIAAAGADRPGALTAADLQQAAERLNAGRAPEASPWSQPQATDGPTTTYPAPARPANPDAQPAPEEPAAPEAAMLSAEPRATYANWFEVGKAQVDTELRRTAVSYVNGYGTAGGLRDAEPVNGSYQAALSGSGTSADPYVLSTPEAFAWWGYLVATHDKGSAEKSSYANLGASMDLSGLSYTAATDVGGETFANCLPWVPIGGTNATGGVTTDIYGGNGYTGTFDGKGFGVVNLCVQQRGWKSGLFGELSGPGVIRNVHVLSGYVLGGDRVAGVVAQTYGEVLIEDCSNAAWVESRQSIGTPVSTGGVVGGALTKGLVTILRCSNSGTVKSPVEAGGILGTGGDRAVVIEDCFNTGSVESAGSAGGIAGKGSAITMKNCFNAGVIAGKGGSIIGSAGGSTTVTDCVYANDIGSVTTTALGISKTLAQLKSADTVNQLNTGHNPPIWTRTDGVNDGLPYLTSSKAATLVSDWAGVGALMEAGTSGLPAKPSTGLVVWPDGSKGTAYKIYNAEQLAWFAYKVNTDSTFGSNSLQLMNDIDLSGLSYTGAADTGGDTKSNCLPWTPIGALTELGGFQFSGKFDGNSHTVSNMRITNDENFITIGLIGSTTNDVMRVNIANSYVNSGAKGASVGALVGQATKTVDRCSVSSNVRLNDVYSGGSLSYIGGLVGVLSGSGSMSDCWSRAVIDNNLGGMALGGLIGSIKDSAMATRCYSSPTFVEVDPDWGATGALSGRGSTSSFTRCFWDGADLTSSSSATTLPDGVGKKVSADELRTSVLALLNNGRPAGEAPWAQDAAVNDGFPTLAGSPILATWQDAAATVTQDQLRRTKVTITDGYATGGELQPAEPSGGSYLPALSGTGTVSDPFVISSPEALAWFSATLNSGALVKENQNVRLGANIDLAGLKYTGKTEAGTDSVNCLEWIPISGKVSSTTLFFGNFDGNNHTVRHMRIDNSIGYDYVGLFSYIYGSVKNLTLTESYVKGGTGKRTAGGIVGVCMSSAIIERCGVSDSVRVIAPEVTSGSSLTCWAGGIVGWHRGTSDMRYCWSRASVTGASVSGHTGTIYLGGLVGAVDEPSVVSCYACPTAISTGANIVSGALAGYAQYGTQMFTYCYWPSDGGVVLPGLGGATLADTNEQLPLAQMRSAAMVEKLNAGSNGTNPWVRQPFVNDGYPTSSGLYAEPVVLESWKQVGDVQTEIDLRRTKVTMVDGFATGGELQPAEPSGGNYQPALSGTGRVNNPYILSTPEALAWWAQGNSGSPTTHAKLGASLDMAGLTYTNNQSNGLGANLSNCLQWRAVGDLHGSFDGDGHVVKNVRGMGSFFGYVASGSSVKNFGITASRMEDSDISMTENSYFGALVGECAGAVQQCYATADVAVVSTETGRDPGGLVGNVAADATLENCWTRAQVSSASAAGGMVGTAADTSTLTGCYSAPTSITSTQSRVGLFAATNDSTSVTNCFYKEQSGFAGVSSSGGGTDSFTAKSEADMKTFDFAKTLNGSKFVGDAAGTTSTAWTTDAQKNGATTLKNDGYPVLGTLLVTTSWEDVAKQVDAGGLGSKPVEEDVTFPGETTAKKAYKIYTPEQLAWFAYKVNNDNTNYMRKNVQLAADIDLSGLNYTATGGQDVGENFANCLRWRSIGPGKVNGHVIMLYSEHFDGAGYQIKNLCIDAEAGEAPGLIGMTTATIERLVISSGYLNLISTDSASGSVQAGLGTLACGASSLRNCASLMDIGGIQAPNVGGLVGSSTNSVSNCYYAGKSSITLADAVVGKTIASSSPSYSNLYYDSDKNPTAPTTVSGATAKTTAELQSEAMATVLTNANATWETDWRGRNSGYVVVQQSGFEKPTNWENVGKMMDEGKLSYPLPTEQTVTWGDGTQGQAYVVSTPEQLAWYAYKVNNDNANYKSKNVQLAADIDLAGFNFTGAAAPGDKYENCLEWTSIGYSMKDTTAPSNSYLGHFDGAGYVINNVRLINQPDRSNGFIGKNASGSQVIERVGLASGRMSGAGGYKLGTLLGGDAFGYVRNCFSRIDISEEVGTPENYTSGLVSRSSLHAFENCYYAGTIEGLNVAPASSNYFGISENAKNLYYDSMKASGADAKVIGKTTAELKAEAMITLLNAGGNVWDTDWMGRNGGYPVVKRAADPARPADWLTVGRYVQEGHLGSKPQQEQVAFGDGTQGQAYVIKTPEQLAWIGYMLTSYYIDASMATANVQLAADIDLAGFSYMSKEASGGVGDKYANCLPWNPILATTYTGHFDGGGYQIKNVRLSIKTNDDYMGFFGDVKKATIERVGLASGHLETVNSALVGTLVAEAYETTIKNCYSLIDIVGGHGEYTSRSGALVGVLSGSADAGTIDASYYAGTCTNTTPWSVVGTLSGTATKTYFDGDKSSSMQTSPGIEKCTTAQMKSWALAYQMNGEKLTPWRADSSDPQVNGGYPLLCKPGETGAASTWADVAQWVDEYKTEWQADNHSGPYELDTPEKLAWWAYKVNTDAATFNATNATLLSNLNMDGQKYTGKTTPGENNDNCLTWVPISWFNGEFEGSSHTLSNLRIRESGFFEVFQGLVSNLTLEGYASGSIVGAFASSAPDGTTEVTNCVNRMTVEADTQAAGIFAETESSPQIYESVNEGRITLTSGPTDPAIVRAAGGIVASSTEAGGIHNCYNTGSISGSNGFVGGIVGSNDEYGVTENCFNVGALTGTEGATLGDIEATENDTVKNCYASTNKTAGDSTNADGSIRLKHLTEAQMKTKGFALNLNGNTSGAGTVWTHPGGAVYPTFGVMPAATWLDIGSFVAEDQGTFGAFKPTTGTGTELDPLQLSTPEALACYAYIRDYANSTVIAGSTVKWIDAHLKLTDNIDLKATYGGTSTKWKAMGETSSFASTFDGGGFEVRNLVEGGLFYGTSSATVKNLGIGGQSTISAGAPGGAGALVCQAGSTNIENCYVTKDVKVAPTGAPYAGGLVGTAAESTTINNCWSRASVSGATTVGGLVGHTTEIPQINNSYAAPASLPTTGTAGVLVGNNEGGSASNSYYQETRTLQGAGVGSQNGMTKKTKAEMRTPMTALALNNGALGEAARWTWNPFKNDAYPALGKPPLDKAIDSWAIVGGLQTENDLRHVAVTVDPTTGFGTAGDLQANLPGVGGANYTPALSGEGTAAKPYILNTPEAFAWWAYMVNTKAATMTHTPDGTQTATSFEKSHAELGANINLLGSTYTGKTDVGGATFANCLAWMPVGGGADSADDSTGSTNAFRGEFNGQGHSVSNMRVYERRYKSGLFGAVYGPVSISNVHVTSGYVRSTDRVGGILGQAEGAVTVENCSNAATIVSEVFNGGPACNTGGVVGCALGSGGLTVRNCSNTGAVSSVREAGGVLGLTNGFAVTIENSFNTGAVSSSTNTGGIAGGSTSLTIKNCYNAGTVTGTGGSISGNATAAVTNCYFANDVSSPTNVTKGTGVSSDHLKSWGAAYALNEGNGTKMPAACTTWRVAASASDNNGFPVLVAAGAAGEAAHLQNAANWGDVGEWVEISGTKKPTAGTGAAASPFEIATPEALAWFAHMVNEHASTATPSGGVNWNAASIKLTADINLAAGYGGTADFGWVPIGNNGETTPFAGTIDGTDKTITNLATTGTPALRQALVGTAQGATLRNLHVQGGVTGTEYVAALIAMMKGGTIEDCTAQVGIQGANFVGGLVGEASVGVSNITRSSHEGTVAAAGANQEAGGLVGTAYGATCQLVITDCFHRGDVNAPGVAGGLFGRGSVSLNGANVTLTNSYAAGMLTSDNKSFGVAPATPNSGTVTMTNCFYDAALTPGLPTQAGEKARTAAEMTSPVTALMLNAGRTGANAPWGWDAAKNGKYPILGTPTADASMVDWSHVGALQDETTLRNTTAVIDPTTGFGTTGTVGTTAPAVAALSGNGTSNDPYVVRTPEALAWFAYQVNNNTSFAGKHYVQLDANIDLQGAQYTGATGTAAADSLQWDPIGKNETGKKFSGSVMGMGYTIDHLYINKPTTDNVGLVGWADKVEIRRLAIGANSSVTGRENVAAFVGASKAAANALSITDCYNRASVAGTNRLGAFLGDDSGSYTGSNAATFENCYNAGQAKFSQASNATFKDCYADTEVFANAASATEGTQSAGSVKGLTTAQLKTWGAPFQLNGGSYFWPVEAQDVWRMAADGENDGYPVFISPAEVAAGTRMNPASSWADVGQWVDIFGYADDGDEYDTDPKPTLKTITFSDGSTGQGYEIDSMDALAWFAYKVNDGSQKAANAVFAVDITLVGAPYCGDGSYTPDAQFSQSLRWVPIGTTANKYTGRFDGRGHNVQDMRVDQGTAGDGGFFGVVGEGVKIENLGVYSGYVQGEGYHMGGLIGYVQGNNNAGATVTNCYNAAEVHGGTNMGGVVGTTNEAPGTTISKCWNTGTLVQKSGTNSVGGIVGKMHSGNNTISNCYNRGEIKGVTKSGGIVGDAANSGYTITGCYNAGKVTGSGGSIAGAGSYTATYNYYANDLGADSVTGTTAATKALTSDQLRTWGAAYALGGGNGTAATNPTALKAWRQAANTNTDNPGIDANDENAGFPVLTAFNATGDNAHLQPAATWGDVGAWVENFDVTAKKPTGDGSTGSAFQIDSPEKLAWFACVVSTEDLHNDYQNADLTAAIDLTGSEYTGRTPAPGAFSDCLAWSPIGVSDETGDHFYFGNFNGGGYPIDNLNIVGSAFHSGGLFGNIESATIENVALQSGAMDLSEGSNTGSLVGIGAFSASTVKNCYSRVDVTAVGAGVQRSGGLIGVDDGVVSSCYYAGSLPTGSTLDPVAGRMRGTMSNVLYLNGTSTAPNTKKVTTDQLASWGAAYQLNGATGALANMTTWRKADAGENDGFPVLIKQSEAVTSMQPAAAWGDVGLWVDVFAPVATRPTEGAGGVYTVTSAPQLAWFAYKVNSDNTNFGGKSAVLGQNIDLFGGDYTDQTFDNAASLDANLAKALPWTPIGSGADTTTFRGTFDGAGYRVSHAYINEPSKDHQGLFGSVSRATITGVSMAASSVTGQDNVGALVGSLSASTAPKQLAESSVGTDVKVSGTAKVGGLVGYASGNNAGEMAIQDCYSRATVTGTTYVGGVVGELGDAHMKNCYGAGAMTATNAGAVVGYLNNGIAKNSYYPSASGLQGVGSQYASTNETLGLTDKEMTSRSGADLAMRLNNLRTGADAKWRADWLGTNDRMAVLASALVGSPADWAAVGKLQDENDLRHTIVYTDTNGTGVGGAVQADLPGQNGADYIPALAGTGVNGDPYIIRTPEALAWFAYMTNTDESGASYRAKHVQLGENVSLMGDAYTGGSGTPLQWASIAAKGAGHGQQTGNYSGTFNGAGKVIDHLYQHNASAAAASGWGLIAFASSGGVVTDVTLDDVDIDVAATSYTSPGKYITVGGIASQLTGGAKIQRCAVRSGTIKGASNAEMTGGLVGDIHNGGGSIENCYVRANVGENASKKNGGGLVGRSNTASTVKNSYFAGTAAQPIGYSSPNNITATNVLYDVTAFGSTAAAKAGVTGVTTAQLKSWGAAYQLNAPLDASGTQQNLNALVNWRQAASDADNGGYPVLTAVGALDAEAHMQPATDWGEVGAWVDAFAPADKKPAGTGTDADKYQIGTPEQLAWFAYKVNTDNTTFKSKSAALTAPVSLHGGVYTGNVFDASAPLADNLATALNWVPIAFPVDGTWTASFDGRKQPVSHLVTTSEGDRHGLFGFSAGLLKGVSIAASHIKGSSCVGAVTGIQSVGELSECSVGADVIVEGANASIGGVAGSLLSTTFRDVMSRAEVKAPADKTAGGLVGSIRYSTVERSYFAGTVEAGTKGAVYGVMGGPGNSFSECYYLNDGTGLTGPDSAAKPLTSNQLASWGAAYQLNTGDGVKALGALKVWRQPADGVNDGYPVLVPAGATGADAHMQPAATWGDVGLWVDVFATDKKPTTGGANGIDKPWPIASAEQLAWLAYRVNEGTLATNHNAKLTASFDLVGNAYTGKSGTGGDTFANCLNWVPIGNGAIDGKPYLGAFDGQGNTVSSLRSTATQAGKPAGLFGSVKDGRLFNLTLSGGFVSSNGTAGGLVGMHASNATIEDCTVDVSVSGAEDCVAGVVAAVYPGTVTIKKCVNLGDVNSTGNTSTGGIVGGAAGGSSTLTIENCYNRGAITASGRDAAGIYGRGSVSNGGKTISIKNCYNAGVISGATISSSIAKIQSGTTLTNCYYDSAKCTDVGAQAGETSLTATELKSWRTAFALNEDSFVGKKNADNSAVASTVWTVDTTSPQTNDGYPVFGNLSVGGQQELEFAANDALNSTDGTISADLTTALAGKVDLAEAPDVSGLGNPAAGGAALTAPATVKDGFTSWGTDNANAKIGLTAGSATVLGSMAGRDVLAATGGVSKVHVNLAAAYNSDADRTVSFVAMDDTTAYRIKVKVPVVTSKTVDVIVPVEGGVSSFDITPDAKAHTLGGSGKEAAKAKAASVFKNNGKVPMAGAVSKVAPLAKDEAAGITEVLNPGTAAPTDTKDPITNAGNTRLGITTAPTSAAAGNTVAPAINSPLIFAPGTGGAPGTIPLYFAVQGSTDAAQPNALAWQYFLEYTGTYLKEGTKFGFSTEYEVYLSKDDVANKAVVSTTKLTSGGAPTVNFSPAALALAAGAYGRGQVIPGAGGAPEAPAGGAPVAPGQDGTGTAPLLLATKEEEV